MLALSDAAPPININKSCIEIEILKDAANIVMKININKSCIEIPGLSNSIPCCKSININKSCIEMGKLRKRQIQ